MNPASILVVFTIIWWLVFFIVLPVGIKPDYEAKEGNMHGSPKKVNIIRKMLITSIVTIILTALYFYFIENGYLDFIQLRGYM